MNRTVRVTVSTLLAVYSLGFIFFFAYAFHSARVFAIGTIAQPGPFFWQWIFAHAWTSFFDNLLALHMTGVAIAYSLFVNPTGAGVSRLPFTDLVSASLLVFLVLTGLYVLLAEFSAPANAARLDDIDRRTALIAHYDAKAREAEAQSHGLEDAVFYYRTLLLLNPSDISIQDRAARVATRLAASRSTAAEPADVSPEAADVRSMTARDFTTKARRFLEDHDPISARYYGALALELEPGSAVARDIFNRAGEAIAEVARFAEDRQRLSFFQRKQQAVELFLRGDYLPAYEALSRLAAEAPGDKELQDYRAQAHEAVRRTFFFLEDIAPVADEPMGSVLFFRNGSPQAGMEQFIKFGRMVHVDRPRRVEEGGGTFFFDVEVFGLEEGGRIAYHVTAPYGKYLHGHISLNGIYRSDVRRGFGPRLVAGRLPAGQDMGLFRIAFSPEELVQLSSVLSSPRNVGMAAAWNSRLLLERAGYAAKPAQELAMLRLLQPFNFFSLSFLTMALAWRFRSRYLAVPVLVLAAFVPVLPFAFSIMCELLVFGQRIVLGAVLFSFSLLPALAAMVVLQALVLIFSMIYLARQCQV